MSHTTQITPMRDIRLRHGITLEELAKTIGVTNQYMSRAELSQVAPTWTLEKQCEAAFERIIAQRYAAARALEEDYRTYKGVLLSHLEEARHGV